MFSFVLSLFIRTNNDRQRNKRVVYELDAKDLSEFVVRLGKKTKVTE